MDGIEARALYSRLLLERVRADRYPSNAQMEVLEQVLPPQLVPEYLEVLLEKVLNDRWPSPPMMRRIQRVAWSIR